MANATATSKGGSLFISLPANVSNIVLQPKTSGTTEWVNFCSWQGQWDTTGPSTSPNEFEVIGSWSAHQANLEIESNPLNLIDTTTKHGTITSNTNPSTARMTNMSLAFTHKNDQHPTNINDKLNYTVTNASDDYTVITIMAEDGGDKNYLDFQMIITITDN